MTGIVPESVLRIPGAPASEGPENRRMAGATIWARAGECKRATTPIALYENHSLEKTNLQFALPVAPGSRCAGDPRADRNPRATSSIGAAFRAFSA
jgi:hypothetical protein